jgi:chlorophyllide a reductase subunit Y
VRYDDAADVPMLNDGQPEGGMGCSAPAPAPAGEGAAADGCHAGKDTMRAAAEKAGKSELLEQFAEDYPTGPHDQPQSMCPAFGSLRVGLRMRRTATVLSGSACCVYGLTFTSHFYGAKRTVGYVPFNSETLVTGKLFEDIATRSSAGRSGEIRHRHRDQPVRADGLRRAARLLPKEINGVRIVGIDVPGFGVPTHAEAKDVLAGAMLPMPARKSSRARLPRRARPGTPASRPSRWWARCSRPIRSPSATCWSRWGWPPVRLCRRANGVSSIPRWTALPLPPSTRSTPPRSANSKRRAAPGIGSAPVGIDGTASLAEAIGEIANVSDKQIEAAKHAAACHHRRAVGKPIKGRITVSGYEGSELLVARLLIEAAPRYLMSARPAQRPLLRADREWLRQGCARPVPRLAGAGPRCHDDVQARPRHRHHAVVQNAKERAIPALYFTNLISARPLMGAAGAGSLVQVVNAAIANKARFDEMTDFFEGRRPRRRCRRLGRRAGPTGFPQTTPASTPNPPSRKKP